MALVLTTHASRQTCVEPRLVLSKLPNENGGISPDVDQRLSKAPRTSQGFFWYRL